MLTLLIDGMSCPHCVAHVRKALEAVPGVEAAEVSLGRAVVTGHAAPEALQAALDAAGYAATVQAEG